MRTPVAIVAVGAVLAAMPWLGLPPFYESFLYLCASWIVLATSWNILSGYAGYFSFGHGAFFGAGMYTTATLAAQFDWSVPVDAARRGAVARCSASGSAPSSFASSGARRAVRAADARGHVRARARSC
jgi:branched-chain amino acid transport system permease protein